MIARLVAAAAALVATNSGCAQEVNWSVRAPEAPLVSYRGVANFDSHGGGTNSMLYPAPGLAGFLAVVATHGLLNEVTRRHERSAIQEKADEILEPLRPVLAVFDNRKMVEQALPLMASPGRKRLIAPAEGAGEDWVIESVPEYAMTQDQRGVILDNGITLYRSGQSSPAYRGIIRVVSTPVAADAVGHWALEEGRNLREISAVLWAQSVDIAIRQLATPLTELPARTIRYLEGGGERIERAEVLEEGCQRLLIRSLRGEVMSVPARPKPEGCAR